MGRPRPTVTAWLRNGVPIDTTNGDSNFIISSTGHLLILQARLVDTANYSCVAANTARQRTSPPALVTVYSKFNMMMMMANISGSTPFLFHAVKTR